MVHFAVLLNKAEKEQLHVTDCEPHLNITGYLVVYEITQFYLIPTHLYASWNWYLIYQPRRAEKLSCVDPSSGEWTFLLKDVAF